MAVNRFCNNDPVNNVDPLGLALYAFDGTDNWPEQKDRNTITPTNVRKFFLMYRSKGPGRSLYLRGVGNPVDSQGIRRVAGLVGGYGGKDILNDAMRQLDENTAAKDNVIDIIGFSRGSALALEFCNMIKDKYPDKRIRFLGLFDTVGAFGLANNPLQLPVDAVEHYVGKCASWPLRLSYVPGWLPDSWFQKNNIGYRLTIPDNVDSSFHAMAYHENRDAFDVTRLKGATEMWFYGVHSNIGGGYKDTGLSDIALLWMMRNARSSGIAFDWDTGKLGFEIKPHVFGELRNEKSALYGYKKRDSLPGDKCHPVLNRRLIIEGEHE